MRTIKLRSTASGVNLHPQKKDLLAMMQMVLLVARGRPPSEQLALEDQRAEMQSLKSESSARTTQSPLPLPAPAEAERQQHPLPTLDVSKRKTVPELLADLKMAYQVSRSKTKVEEEEETENPDTEEKEEVKETPPLKKTKKSPSGEAFQCASTLVCRQHYFVHPLDTEVSS